MASLSPPILSLKSLFLSLLFTLNHAVFAVTVYGQTPLGMTMTSSLASGPVPTLPAYDKTVLIPPGPPQPPTTAFGLELQPQAASVPGLSITQSGAFLGFSIEMSVVNQVLGKNSSHIAVPLLNLLGNLQHRAGSVRIRCGGNTQELARFTDQLDNGAAIAKEKGNALNPTQTPAVLYTMDLFYIMSNISSLVNVKWYLGIPFNDTNFDLRISEYGQAILGDNLLALQAGNEPDLYARHQKRPETWHVADYMREFGDLVSFINNHPNIPIKNNLIGPSVASADWTPEMVWDAGYIETFKDVLSIIAVEHYPNNNCFAAFGGSGSLKIPQDEFAAYLNHNAGRDLVRPYLNSSAIALAAGKPFMMFETNTASCGGFPGISDTFGATLWALDYGYQMAYANFSGALFHVGGQNVYYNPFTAPPTNQTAFHQWTVGAIFYSVLVMTESFGKSNQSRIIDLNANGDNIFTPAYAIYDQDVLSKVALFNYVDDASGASDYTATISVGGGNTGAPNSSPAEVKVKYLAASSVSTGVNITWANQTFGNAFEVDGHLKGDLEIVTVPCDQASNTCQIRVPAPGFALVFINGSPEVEESDITFSTTAFTKLMNTATVDPAVLETSNGMSGKDRSKMGSTSFGSIDNGASAAIHGYVSVVTAVTSMMAGWILLRHVI
ncbi:glycoside hydrolase family 79 protein [Pleurotus ostreatus PC15]|uniref:Glycoside hydrolase family 79 protein n=2 Tax=Pleurotus TaxID=5320 RepID=A0A067NJ20_PLEO1|nr:hypothetical protein CCMSSC00406_0008592 [Pleurotus cornucopiae]KDQ24102.1 glycoside hydrolase family 79 protein [Pleurotus ostreatus PC15]